MKNLVIVRGGGDLATGTIYKLYKCGYKVLILETSFPSAIRRNVAFSEAVYEGTKTVEDLTCYLAADIKEAMQMLEEDRLVMMIDPEGACIRSFEPMAVVDAILAKKNLGTSMDMAEIVVGLGPGFTAKEDVHAIVETKRGHSLGRIIYDGTAIPDTGVPGLIGGYAKERVIHSPAEGVLRVRKNIADIVKKGEVIAVIETEQEEIPVCAGIDGILRGMIRDGYPVTKGFKMADIDPRMEELKNCYTISDKARCIAGGVLEAIMFLDGKRQR